MEFDFAEHTAPIACDSPQQIAAMGAEHMLHGHPEAGRIMHLGDPGVLEKRGAGPSLFLSSGLAGSEVAALAAVLAYLDGV